MAWTWRHQLRAGGEAVGDETFPSQADAESWLGEQWRELRERGVAAVTLLEDGREVYGPMGLDPE